MIYNNCNTIFIVVAYFEFGRNKFNSVFLALVYKAKILFCLQPINKNIVVLCSE